MTRLWLEESSGFRQHQFADMTRRPAPCLTGRPVLILIEGAPVTRIWAAGYSTAPGQARGAVRTFTDVTDRPYTTLLGAGANATVIEPGDDTMPPASGKPPYAVPSMTDIAALPHNGFTIASAFAGGGGSSTGYRMAGFRVGWACEFIPAAAATYRANADPGTVLETRDVREVTTGQVLAALGVAEGDLDLLDGSPPCDPFSTAGNREKDWGHAKDYIDGTRQRTDDLFYEYVRLVAGIQPRVFVAENVAGLVKGTAKGYFLRILAALRGCGYAVRAKVLDASWLGVPQARHRVIFVGVRDDLAAIAAPAFPAPLPYQYTVRDALPWLLQIGQDYSRPMAGSDRPAATLTGHAERSRMNSVTAGDIFRHGRRDIAGGDPKTITYPGGQPSPPIAADGLANVAPHQACIVEDAAPSLEMGAHGYFPGRSVDLAAEPAPSIAGAGFGSFGYMLARGGPVTTDPETGADITIGPHQAIYRAWLAAHPNAAAAGLQCRKLTLGELRRLGGFPDDYILEGSYAQRWERVGQAVPPVMMFHVAAAVRDKILGTLRAAGKI